jgi:hypothetical protein
MDVALWPVSVGSMFTTHRARRHGTTRGPPALPPDTLRISPKFSCAVSGSYTCIKVNTSFEIVAKFKHMGTIVTNQNFIQEENERN